MSTHENRARIKRQIGYGAFQRENDLNRAWSVSTYVHVGGEKYPATDLGDKFMVRIAIGVYIYGETLEKARDRVIEALA